MVGEVGELSELFQWHTDASAGPGLTGWDKQATQRVAEEMSDVLCYLTRMADVCGIDLAAAVQAKIVANAAKYPADLVRGSSKKYNEYPRGDHGDAI